ncbi:MAG: TraR/DksA C4-type zinc finger protein [Candidatus Azobacteroides pseudotrichonymphae]|jgi:RNA polymerase-binding transcription factor DksA|uniref:DnaK suppressor protein n=1 Tax=Azobacteroides pseudotrichonymphae genomovar. CFP2 TaxID=511995 RepID=B6YQN7_AZOPC|nr:TraR/DksA C4-type zinc finger protein [Candidatus Azobacteroides pseudotrichonymphae]BAG83509.1 DnaK suppressor protein [Candidatus Azobacteroides pseudotrichonymphae genomovar. CFP2]GMO32849.1 MAG: TraR/DksA C4-type zinc finger protein [Candidatus Azobacteroides pseudotrichonymphae]
MSKGKRYSDEELEEFRTLILEKLTIAEQDYNLLKSTLVDRDGNDTIDSSPVYKTLEEGGAALSREETNRLAQRQLQFMQSLKAALKRIENKTYGICRITGELIPKKRLRAVPHSTLSIEAKKKKE